MIRNIKGKIRVLKQWFEYDAHCAYIMFIANKFEIQAMFREAFQRGDRS